MVTIKLLVEVGPNDGPGLRFAWSVSSVRFGDGGRTIPGDEIERVTELDSGEAADETSALLAAGEVLREHSREEV